MRGTNGSSSALFFEGKTQIEVADEIHISQAQVFSPSRKNALRSMYQYLKTEGDR